MEKKNVSNKNSNDEKELSFVEKVKTDKKYSAKVQLIGYGVLIVALILYLNISSLGSNTNNMSNTIISGNGNNRLEENAYEDKSGLLEQLSNNNYKYDVKVDVLRKVNNADREENEDIEIRYYGSIYKNSVLINKEDSSGSSSYYKVDNNYYTKLDNDMKLMDEDDIYNIIDGEYIEIFSILKLLNRASLDHVTDYSSGKKEYVYHLKVRDVVVSYKLEDVIEIEIEEENNILKIDIDYSNLLKVIDEDIVECEVDAVISDIGKVEEFLKLDKDNNLE